MLLGIGLTATVAASVTSYFVNEDKGMVEMEARLERMEQILLELKAQVPPNASVPESANVPSPRDMGAPPTPV